MPEPTVRTDALVRLLALSSPDELASLRARHPDVSFSEGRTLGPGGGVSATAEGRDAVLDLVHTALRQCVPAAERAAENMRIRLERAAKLRAAGTTLTVVASGGTFGSLIASLAIAPIMALLSLVASLFVVIGEYLGYSFHDRTIQPGLLVEQLLHGVSEAQQVRIDIEIARVSDASMDRIAETVRRANYVAEELGVLIKKAGAAAAPKQA
ncbi:MAG: hypothetical protein ACTS27_02920 [Phycisphaerales bacterium]